MNHKEIKQISLSAYLFGQLPKDGLYVVFYTIKKGYTIKEGGGILVKKGNYKIFFKIENNQRSGYKYITHNNRIINEFYYL